MERGFPGPCCEIPIVVAFGSEGCELADEDYPDIFDN